MWEEAKILVVEDSSTQAMLLKGLLEEAGYRVRVAKHGREGLAMAQTARPDLIISDIQMPVMDGYELCRAIRGEDALRDIPVVLLTMLTDVKDVIRALEVTADYFLIKPCKEEELLAKVKSILRLHSLQRDLDTEGGLEVVVGEERRVICSSRRQMLSLLLSTYESAIEKNRDLNEAREELDGHRRHLEEMVEARTQELEEKAAQLKKFNEELAQIKERKRQEKEMRSLAALSSPSQTGVTARMYGTLPLIEGFPDAFHNLVEGYEEVMDLALDQRTYKVKHDISGRLGAMAETLGFYKAGPRDVVDIHSAAVKEKAMNAANMEKKKAYTDEGWIMILELMGHLVSFYRSRTSRTGFPAKSKDIKDGLNNIEGAKNE